MDESTRLRAELDELNLKCQTARDNEVRYALQRSRLEAERAKLLVRMMETMAPTSAVAPTAPYRVVVQAAPVSPTAPMPVRGSAAVEDTVADAGRVKPEGLPSVPAMVEAVLQDAPKGLRPCEIRAASRNTGGRTLPVRGSHRSSGIWAKKAAWRRMVRSIGWQSEQMAMVTIRPGRREFSQAVRTEALIPCKVRCEACGSRCNLEFHHRGHRADASLFN
jgi:hypothetical protein